MVGTVRSDGEAVLQLPEQRFYSAGPQIAGGQIERSLVIQQWMRCGQKSLGVFRGLPNLLGQGGNSSNALEALALSGTELPFFLPALQGRPWHDDLLHPGLLPVREAPDQVLQRSIRKPPAYSPLQVGDGRQFFS